MMKLRISFWNTKEGWGKAMPLNSRSKGKFYVHHTALLPAPQAGEDVFNEKLDKVTLKDSKEIVLAHRADPGNPLPNANGNSTKKKKKTRRGTRGRRR